MLQRSIDLRAAPLGAAFIAVIAGLVVPIAVSRAGYFDPPAPPSQAPNVAAAGAAFNFQAASTSMACLPTGRSTSSSGSLTKRSPGINCPVRPLLSNSH